MSSALAGGLDYAPEEGWVRVCSPGTEIGRLILPRAGGLGANVLLVLRTSLPPGSDRVAVMPGAEGVRLFLLEE